MAMKVCVHVIRTAGLENADSSPGGLVFHVPVGTGKRFASCSPVPTVRAGHQAV